MKKKFIIVVTLVVFVCILPGYRWTLDYVNSNVPSMVLVIDPGHGGLDGGASAKDGTQEKDLNLAIAKALEKEAEGYGIQTILTRETEDGLYEEDNTSGRWSKVGDMRVRKNIIEKASPDLVISIHLNNFLSDTGVKGAQVFYPADSSKDLKEENMALAEDMQKALNEEVNGGKDRIILQKNGMYLFKNAQKHMLLIECGFLSNPDDASNLKDEKYQQKIAKVIMKTVAKNYNLKEQKSQNIKVIQGRTKKG